MADNNKEFDLLASLVYNPDLGISDFKKLGITPDNLELKSRSDYENLPQVKEAFKDESGNFDKKAFDKFYDNALLVYNNYSVDEYISKATELFGYLDTEWDRPQGSKTIKVTPSFSIDEIPQTQSFGIDYINKYGQGLFAKQSAREIGQQQKVVDFETGKTLDWTPDDKSGLLDALFRPTLVLASYDKDEFGENGELLHKKGDLKYNENGLPYYETLGNRSVTGKQVLAYSDSLTREGSWLNKYDFFDSDDLEKSFMGTLAKTAFMTVPYLIPGVGEVVGAVTAFAALNRVLPVLGKAIASIAGGNGQDAFTEKMNKWEATFARFDQSVSDKSQGNLVTFENLGNLVSSISGQLFQQRVISSIPLLLNKAGDVAKQAKWGRGLAYTYMSLTSAQDSFDTFKEAGASDMVAGWAFVVNAIALGGLMATNYGKGLLFKGTWLDENFLRQPAIEAANQVRSKLTAGIENAPAKEKAKFIQGLLDIYNKHFSSAATETFLNRGLSEALEEVMEEGIIDVQKALTNVMQSIGINVGEQKLDFGLSLQDIARRYGMAAAGGFLGGGIFHLQGKWDNFLANDMVQHTDEDSLKKLTYYISQGRGQEIRDIYTQWHKKGALGSTSLGTSLTTIASINGEETVSEPSNGKLSQNDVVYNTMMQYINTIEDTISKEGLMLDTGSIVRKALNGYKESYKSLRGDTLINLGVHDLLINDIYDVAAKIVAKTAEINKEIDALTVKNDSTDAKKQTEENIKNSEKLKTLKEDLDALREERDTILKGEKNWKYVGQAIFASNPELAKNFIDLRIEKYSQIVLGRNYNSLSEEEKEALNSDYALYMKDEGKNKVLRAADLYIAQSQRYSERLMAENEKLKGYQLNDSRSVGTRFQEELSKRLTNWQTLAKQYGELVSKENKSQEDLDKLEELKTKLEEEEKAINDSSENAYSFLIHKSGDNERIIQLLSQGLLRSEQTGEAYALIKQMYQRYASNKAQLNNDYEYNALLRNTVGDYLKVASVERRIDNWLTNLFLRESNNGTDEGLWQSWLDENGLYTALYDDENAETNYNSDLLKSIKTLANTFIQNIGVNNTVAINALNEIKSSLKDTGFNSDDINLLVAEITPQYIEDGELLPITSFMEEIDQLRKNITYSSFTSLLQDFGTNVFGDRNSILDLIENEKRKLANAPNLQDYFIRNPEIIKEFDEAIELIRFVRGLIKGSIDKTNASINSAKSKEGFVKLAELDENTARILYRQSFDLENEILTLKGIAELNRGRILKVHEEIDKHMRGKFIYSLINNPAFVQKFGTYFYTTDDKGNKTPINIKKICDDILQDRIDLSKSETADPAELMQFEVEFETVIYKAVKESTIGNDNKAIAVALVDLFPESWKMDTTVISTETETITAYSLLSYLKTILSVPADSFYTRYESVTQSEDSKFAPIYSQEMALRNVVAEFTNPELSNYILEELNKRVDTSKIDPKDTNGIKWLSNLSVLRNFVIVSGGAGCGKTTAIATNAAKMFEEYDHEFICLAPEDVQAENLANSIGKDIKKFDKVTFFKNYFGLDLQRYRYNEKTGHTELAEVPVIKDNLFDNSKKLKVLFIDEVSLFTESELKLISDYAVKNGIIVVGLGDPVQNSAKVYSDEILKESGVTEYEKTKSWKSSGLEDCIYFGSSYLTASLRPNNIAKFENFNMLNKVLNDVIEKWKQERWLSINELDKFVPDKIELSYFENPNLFVGEKIVEDDTNLVELAKQYATRGKVTIITDNLNKYQDLPANIDKRMYDKMQGMETDFVIVDVDFQKNGSFEGSPSKYAALRSLYTISQRSRIGTVIKKDGLLDILPEISFANKKEVGQQMIMNEQDIDAFKEKRGQILASLPKSSDLFDYLYKFVAPTPPPSAKPAPTPPPVATPPPPAVSSGTSGTSGSTTPASNPTGNPSAPTSTPIVPQAPPVVQPTSYQQSTQSATIKGTTKIYDTAFINFVKSAEFRNFEQTSKDSLTNWKRRNGFDKINIDSKVYKKLIFGLSSIIKTSWNSVEIPGILDYLLLPILDAQPNASEMIGRLKRIFNSTPEIYILPFNNQYRIMVAKYKDGDNSIQIPIALTQINVIGKYYGGFKRNQNIQKNDGDTTWRPLEEFESEHPEIIITPTWGVVAENFNKENNLGKVSIVMTDQAAYIKYLSDWYRKNGSWAISHYKDLCHMCIQKPVNPQTVLQFITKLKYNNVSDQDTIRILMERGLWENSKDFLGQVKGLDALSLPTGREFYETVESRAWQALPKDRALLFMKIALESLYGTNDFNHFLTNMKMFMHYKFTNSATLDDEVHGMILTDGNKSYIVKQVIQNGSLVGFKAIPYEAGTYVESNSDPFFPYNMEFGFNDICNTLFGKSIVGVEFIRFIKKKNTNSYNIQEMSPNDNIFMLFGTSPFDMDQLNYRMLMHPEFINGVYVDDIAGDFLENPSNFRQFLGNKKGYYIKGDVLNTVWSIDPNAIETMASNDDVVTKFVELFNKIEQIIPNEYKTKWKEHLTTSLTSIKNGKSSDDVINSLIQSINYTMRYTRNNWVGKRIVKNGENYILETFDNFDNWIDNRVKMLAKIDGIIIPNDSKVEVAVNKLSNRKYAVVEITLNNGTKQHGVLLHDGKNYVYRPMNDDLKTFESYIHLQNIIDSLGTTINPILNYLDTLVFKYTQNTNIDPLFVVNWMNDNKDVIGDLENVLNDYLERRILANEC